MHATLDVVNGKMDRSLFEIDALADRLGSDRVELFHFVRDEIRTNPIRESCVARSEHCSAGGIHSIAACCLQPCCRTQDSKPNSQRTPGCATGPNPGEPPIRAR